MKKTKETRKCVICGKEFIPQHEEQTACGLVCANEVRIRAFERKRNADKVQRLMSQYIAWAYHRRVEIHNSGSDVKTWRVLYAKEHGIEI